MNIRVDLKTNIADGSEVVFRSPADCSQVTGLAIYHTGGRTEFAFADAHGNNVGDIDHLFAENAVVKVILDVTAGMAFVQNADTNAYIERTFIKSVNGVKPDANGNVEVAGGGTGLTDTEKNLILALFRNAVYTSANMGDKLAQLEALWSGNGGSGEVEPDEPDVPNTPDEPDTENTTSPKIVEYGKGLANSNNTKSVDNLCYTELYDISDMFGGVTGEYAYIKGSFKYSGDAPAMTSSCGHLYRDGEYATYKNLTALFRADGTEGQISVYVDTYSGSALQLKVTLQTAHIEDSYAYLANNGRVIFAGKNTPYYGMANIDGTPVVSQ